MITRIPSKKNTPPPVPLRTSSKWVSNLKKGDLIKGEIVRDYGKGDVLIQSGGEPFRALTKANVKEGEQYDFRVLAPAVKNNPAVLEMVKSNLSPSIPCKGGERIPALLSEVTSALSLKDLSPRTSTILKNLVHVAASTVQNGPTGDSGSWLSRLITDGGLFYEGKVARLLLHGSRTDWRSKLGNDLKGTLLDLRKSLESESRDLPEIESTAKKVDEAIDLIQGSQLENRELLQEEGCWVIHVPGRPEEGFKGAELYVRRNMKEKETRFSMLLDFTNLGPTEITASILNSTITARLVVSDEKKAELLRTNLPDLESQLKDKGLLPGLLVCVSSGESEKEDIRQKGLPSIDSINLVI